MEAASGTAVAKFPALEELSIEEAREILRRGDRDVRIGLAEVMNVLSCDAQRGDEVLRAMAFAGYLKVDRACGPLWWERTSLGNRLAVEKKIRRIGREKVDLIVQEVVRRARLINSDPDRLHRITLRLFGSSLESRADYGDVDVSIAFHLRKLSDVDAKRIKTALEARQAQHERQTFMGKLFGAQTQDKREIRAALKHGFPSLSLMVDDPMELGTPFKWLVGHDVEADLPTAVSDAIVRPNAPSVFEKEGDISLPPATTMKARRREIGPTTKVPAEGLSIGIDDAEKLEEKLWTPIMTSDGQFEPNDLRHDPLIRFAGFQHLCPIWKEALGGVDMLKKSLEWCEERKVWVRELAPFVSIYRGDRLHIIRLGLRGSLIHVRIGSRSLDGSLLPINRTRVSKVDLAGAYAVMKSLVKMYREARCGIVQAFDADIYVPLVSTGTLPDFTRLAREGKLQEGGFPGLLAAKIHQR